MTTVDESVHESSAIRARTSLPALLAEWAAILGDQRAVTYLDHAAGHEGVPVSWSWQELDQRVSAVAAWVASRVGRDERVAILARQGLEYVAGFLGVLRAGAIAVPLFGPDLPGHTGRLTAVLADCRPSLALTTRAELPGVTRFLGSATPVLAIDAIPPAVEHEHFHVDPDDLAYLQYTSGSTRTPAGVMITHANVVANARQGVTGYGLTTGRNCTVSWLPLFHDMGLVLSIAAPVVGGLRSVFMDPVAFIERPERWLRALSANPGAISAAPNFAYSYCASRVDEHTKARLRLGTVHALINGSEPVQPAALARFRTAFAASGFRPEAQRCSYGLAEATVLVSVTPAGTPPRQTAFDRERLAGGVAIPVPGGTPLVSCGRPADQQVCVVDPRTLRELPTGHVGEVWVSGDNVGVGYWGRPETSDDTFAAARAGEHRGHWLRTGDLGVLHEGELYITGRIKDLVVVDGRNHYPQDLELTVEQAHPAIRPHNVAAFSVPGAEGERVVVVAEKSRHVTEIDPVEVGMAVRTALSAEHGLSVREVFLLEPGGVSRTSSGKVSRSACRARYLAGEFA
ncbi:fatty acyl-AMP ligase [Kutzneria viridogrisea]|uniref:Acyl-CoA synthetase (AMP-forming)/AMP-acid ligase II n=1 Tax=Kutzneria viridogrisea TaxID=47990 RepID=A0ABR6BMH2_9PSEU|nr:acyl-CoA synthetase (AMP-forming)/AMP-acid ligase II [Kutzneria viridogrisea]